MINSAVKRHFSDAFLALLGILSASVGLKAFLLPNSYLDGGVTGVSLLVNKLTNIDISILILVINIPFVLLGYRQISKFFAFKSLITIVALAVAVHFVELPTITDDNLLIAVFGGLLLGAGIGFAVRGGTVIDGTEILAIYLSKKFRTTIGTVILIFNVILFSVAAVLINFEVALFSILTYITASKTADYIIHGIESYIGVTIISEQNETIRIAITEQMGYGATVYKGKRGFRKDIHTDPSIEILHTVVTRLEINRIHSIVSKIDESAFIIEYPINDAKGGIIKKKTKV